VVLESLCQVLHDLRLATTSSIAMLVQEHNPHVSVFEGTCPKLLTVTTLLIDRYLGNWACVAHNFFVICTKPQHRHYQDSSLVNDHQLDLNIHDDLCVFL
jgi:hypothetical protein